MGECSVTCGGGTRIDTRTKISEAKYGGHCDLMGHQKEESCNTEECPRKVTIKYLIITLLM